MNYTDCKVNIEKSYESYTGDQNINYSSNPKDILKSDKNFHEKLCRKRQSPKLSLLNFLVKFLIERKFKINNFLL